MAKRTPNTATHPDDELLQLKTENSQLKAGWQRCQADFDNYRRRVAQEREGLADTIAAETLLDLMPVYDNLQRAFTHLEGQDAAWVDGFRAIAKQLEESFAAHGLERIPTISHPFDALRHDAVSQLPSDEHPADTIMTELESGWMQGGRILKAAKVVVSTGPTVA